jgi:regulatory protein
LNRSNQLAEADSDDERYRQAYATALRLLVRREHSALELAHKLESRQCPARITGQVIATLTDEGALSDRRFSEVYAWSRYERGFGPVRIRAELRERGVEAELVSRALSPLASLWQASAIRQRQKRFGDGPPADFGERARQMRFLQRRGFSGEQIRLTLEEAVGEAG